MVRGPARPTRSTRHDRLSDDALLAAVALGDPDAAAVFVRRFQRRVYGLALTITGDAGLADDVAQQAFLRAWRHAGAYDARRAAVGTWLLVITRNLAIDAVRMRRPAPMDPMLLADLLAPDGSGSPEARAVAADDVRRVRVALGRLPEVQRRAVLLATVGGRTTTEIGAMEGVPVPTAKTRLRDGLRTLRIALVRDANEEVGG